MTSIPIERIIDHANPVESPPWACGILLRPSDVLAAIQEERFQAIPDEYSSDLDYAYHAERIAYLVVHGWDDPIEIDVGVPSMGCHVGWPVLDGNHRLYAAMYRGDPEIRATVSGSLDYMQELFGVTVGEEA